ncbi:MAG: hypothetical protein E6J88_08060, partial [Deltaproteobacteria bacterium]
MELVAERGAESGQARHQRSLRLQVRAAGRLGAADHPAAPAPAAGREAGPCHRRAEHRSSLEGPTPLLWLNAQELKILDTVPKSTVIDAQPAFIGLQFAEPLPAGASTLRIHWEGKLPQREDQGAHRQRENGQWYVLTQGEPLGMRRVFPCFDEPSFKIPWKIS